MSIPCLSQPGQPRPAAASSLPGVPGKAAPTGLTHGVAPASQKEQVRDWLKGKVNDSSPNLAPANWFNKGGGPLLEQPVFYRISSPRMKDKAASAITHFAGKERGFASDLIIYLLLKMGKGR